MSEQDVLNLIASDRDYKRLKDTIDGILQSDFALSDEFLSSLTPLEPIHKFGT